MSRRIIAVLGSLALSLASGLASGCGAPPSEARPARQWRVAIEEAPGSVQDVFVHRLDDELRRRSEGEVGLTIYPYGALGTSGQITEQLHNGTLQLAMSSPGHLGTLMPEVQVFLLHYLLGESPETGAAVLSDPEVVRILDGLYRDKGLAFLVAFSEGPMVWTTQRPVHSPADFDGVRMRVMTSPLLLATYAAYGASPTPLPYSEVYSALQLNMIDGQVNPIFAIEEMSFYEVSDVLTFPGHAAFVTTLAANPAFLAGLSDSERAMLEAAVETVREGMPELVLEYQEERLARMQTRRPELRVDRLDAQQRAPFAERADTITAGFRRDTSETGRALLDAIQRAAVERDP